MHHILFLSGGELVVVFLVFLLLFGSQKVPDLAKGVAKGLKEFKKATDDLKREITSNTGDIAKEITKTTNELKSNINDIGKNISKDMP
jgi:sec-independent protein translocase protein TatA